MEKENTLNNIRKLATIAKIEEIKLIDGADNIEHARVRGWWVVVRKGEFKVGDLCIYIEVDSVLPDGLSQEKAEEWRNLYKQMSKVSSDKERDDLKEQMNEISKLNTRSEFEFLRINKFRVKTRRIFGEISQGICFPLHILKQGEWDFGIMRIIPDQKKPIFCIRTNKMPLSSGIDIEEELDVTELLGVTQYVPPDPAIMGVDAKGDLENVGLIITDEQRLENLSGKYEELKGFKYCKSEKLDGSSVSFYSKNGVFGVCGRTIEFKTPPEDTPINEMNVYWKMAKKLDIENKMKSITHLSNWSLQGELVGEGVQGNIYKIKGQRVCFYDAFDIDKQEYLPQAKFIEIVKVLGLETVPILDEYYSLPEDSLDILKEADVTKTVFGNNPDQLIEGFVFVAHSFPRETRITRSAFGRLSFKAKSRSFDMNKNK